MRRPLPSPSVGYFAYFTEQPYGLVTGWRVRPWNVVIGHEPAAPKAL